MNHNAVKGLRRLTVNISGDQSLAVRNGRPCVKSCDSDLSRPVNEYPRCAHDIHNGNVIGGEAGEGGHAQAADTAHVILGKGPLNPFCM